MENLKQNPIVKKLGLNRILLVCVLIRMFLVFKVVLGNKFPAVDSIKSNTEELEKAKQQLMKLEDKINCPNCGEPVLRSQKFCDKCGAKVAVEEPESTVTVEKTCPNCGETVPGDQLYCANCGAKIE